MTPTYRTILIVERPQMANEVSVMIMLISGVITSTYRDRLRPFDADMPDVINSGIHAFLMDPPTRIKFTVNSIEQDSEDMFATLEDAKNMAKECVKKLQKKRLKVISCNVQLSVKI